MAKNSGGAAGKLSALVAEIEAEADARGEMLAALGVPGASTPRPRGRRNDEPSASRSARKQRASGGKRAPKGTVRALVERVLRDRPGLAAREIVDGADGDTERLVKLGSIRAELQTGRKQGRYGSEGGRWSLTASPPRGGDGTPDAPSSRAPDGAAGVSAEAFQSGAGPSPETDEAAGVSDGNVPGEVVGSGEPESGGGQGKLGIKW